jgi:hypothetical protein
MKHASKVLVLRLKELRTKMRLAETAKEREIYSEAIATCISDLRFCQAKLRRKIIKDIAVALFFIVLVMIILYLISTLREENMEPQSIGHAVTENSN